MVMIGGKDVRVPPSQGRSFYRNLKANGKEARYLQWCLVFLLCFIFPFVKTCALGPTLKVLPFHKTVRNC